MPKKLRKIAANNFGVRVKNASMGADPLSVAKFVVKGSRWALLPRVLWLAFCLFGLSIAWGREVIPPPPRDYVNDAAGVLRPELAAELNRQLRRFEEETSNQIVVAIYPRMESDSSIEDYTVRVAQAWRVGQKKQDNGAVLFVFIQDRSLYIQVGYGLEGALPDILCKQIIENEIVPRFRQGDYSGGIAAGVHAMMAATKGEYKGTGRTAGRQGNDGSWVVGVFFLFIWLLLFIISRIDRGGRAYTGTGPTIFPGGFGRGSGGGGGGWGGFSGGGGSFGGGGAGGRW